MYSILTIYSEICLQICLCILIWNNQKKRCGFIHSVVPFITFASLRLLLIFLVWPSVTEAHRNWWYRTKFSGKFRNSSVCHISILPFHIESSHEVVIFDGDPWIPCVVPEVSASHHKSLALTYSRWVVLSNGLRRGSADTYWSGLNDGRCRRQMTLTNDSPSSPSNCPLPLEDHIGPSVLFLSGRPDWVTRSASSPSNHHSSSILIRDVSL